jgi:DNA-directed RNA polymerase subunit N (RpoN/RPB10)
VELKHDSAFAAWVTYQRSFKQSLPEEQRNALDDIGFDWYPCEMQWKLQYDKLVTYKERCGDCLVPFKWKADPTLARWVNTQRYKKVTMPEQRRIALDSIGFHWSALETTWNAQYSKLVAYLGQNGHCNVPRTYTQDLSLGEWVRKQRKAQETMDEQRRRLLDESGFDWDPFESAWNEKFQKLIAFKKTHGNCDVPANYLQDRSLAQWVTYQRTSHRRG